MCGIIDTFYINFRVWQKSPQHEYKREGIIMNFIKKSKEESDRLLYHAFSFGLVIIFIDFLVIWAKDQFVIELKDLLVASGIIFCLIPILYYKKSKTREKFVLISLVCIECLTMVLYVSSWLYASVLWVLSFTVAALYFDVRLTKMLLFIKIPLIVVGTFMVLPLKGTDYAIHVTVRSAIFICIYLILELLIVGLLFAYMAKKTNGIFSQYTEQNEKVDAMFLKAIKSSQEIDSIIEQLYKDIHTGRTLITDIRCKGDRINEESIDMSRMAVDSVKSMEVMSKTLDDTAKNSENVVSLTNEIKGITQISQNNILQLIEKVTAIDEANQRTSRQFEQLQASTKEIETAIDIINNVAKQTSLLALNATIEAARAGEAGKGFAVVAGEISKLAMETSASAKTIVATIEEINLSATDSMSALNVTSELVTDSLETVSLAKEDFDKLFAYNNRVVQEIDNSKGMIHELETDAKEVQFSFEQTVEQCYNNSSNITDMTKTLLTLEQYFGTITTYAESVQKYSKELVNSEIL